MKIFVVILLGILAISARAADLAKLVLPAKTFGPGWELPQPNLMGNAAAPNYINRKQPHQPVVMVNIIRFPSVESAKAKWDTKFGNPEASEIVKKAEDMTDAYDFLPPAHNKRFMLIGPYWHTVEQVGDKDDRKPFIEAYHKSLEKSAGSGPKN